MHTGQDEPMEDAGHDSLNEHESLDFGSLAGYESPAEDEQDHSGARSAQPARVPGPVHGVQDEGTPQGELPESSFADVTAGRPSPFSRELGQRVNEQISTQLGPQLGETIANALTKALGNLLPSKGEGMLPSRPKMGSIPKFTGEVGTLTFQEWRLRIEQDARMSVSPQPGPMWGTFAASHLDGIAMSHYNSLIRQREAAGLHPFLEWEEFVALMVASFEVDDPEDAARESLDHMSQGSRPVEAYNRAFLRHKSKIISYELPAQEWCRMYRKGLSPEMQEAMAFDAQHKRYTDLEDMMRIASKKDLAKRQARHEASAAVAGKGKGRQVSYEPDQTYGHAGGHAAAETSAAGAGQRSPPGSWQGQPSRKRTADAALNPQAPAFQHGMSRTSGRGRMQARGGGQGGRSASASRGRGEAGRTATGAGASSPAPSPMCSTSPAQRPSAAFMEETATAAAGPATSPKTAIRSGANPLLLLPLKLEKIRCRPCLARKIDQMIKLMGMMA